MILAGSALCLGWISFMPCAVCPTKFELQCEHCVLKVRWYSSDMQVRNGMAEHNCVCCFIRCYVYAVHACCSCPGGLYAPTFSSFSTSNMLACIALWKPHHRTLREIKHTIDQDVNVFISATAADLGLCKHPSILR